MASKGSWISFIRLHGNPDFHFAHSASRIEPLVVAFELGTGGMSQFSLLQPLIKDREPGAADPGNMAKMSEDGVPLRRDADAAPVRGCAGEVGDLHAADVFDIS